MTQKAQVPDDQAYDNLTPQEIDDFLSRPYICRFPSASEPPCVSRSWLPTAWARLRRLVRGAP